MTGYLGFVQNLFFFFCFCCLCEFGIWGVWDFDIDLFVFVFCNEDVSTDGKWCYIVFWVMGKENTRWSLLKMRLIGACPSCSSASGMYYYCSDLQPPRPSDVFLLTFCCNDRTGLLHGNLWKLTFFNFNSYMCIRIDFIFTRPSSLFWWKYRCWIVLEFRIDFDLYDCIKPVKVHVCIGCEFDEIMIFG